MIQAVMMFALGFCVCGLIALAASSALARRTRRLAEYRVKLRYATKRREFQTERDEFRARHAVEVQRLERNLRDTGDQATAYRLEAALKDIEINALNSELDDKEEEIDDLSDRLDNLHEQLRESDRKLAESGTALRAARHALQTKSADDALGGNPYANGYHADADAEGGGNGHAGDNRSWDLPSPDTVNIEKVASEIHRISNETELEIRELPMPDAQQPATPVSMAAARLEMLDPSRRETPPAAPPATPADKADAGVAESRFLSAVNQLRTLKKAGGGAAE